MPATVTMISFCMVYEPTTQQLVWSGIQSDGAGATGTVGRVVTFRASYVLGAGQRTDRAAFAPA